VSSCGGARERFEAAGLADEMAGVLNQQGLLDAQLGRYTAASAAYREALAWAQRAPRDARLELSIRLNLAELDLEAGRLLEAEAELRRAEQVAIGGHVIRRLAQIYTLMGRLRGAQGDETGFVFFEQAIELAKAVERSVATEAQVYHAYGLFRSRLGQQDESPCVTSSAPGSSSTRSAKRSSASASRRSCAPCRPDRRLVVGQRVLRRGRVGLAVAFFFCVDVVGFAVALDPVAAGLVDCCLPPPHAVRRSTPRRGREDGSRHGTLPETGFGSNIRPRRRRGATSGPASAVGSGTSARRPLETNLPTRETRAR